MAKGLDCGTSYYITATEDSIKKKADNQKLIKIIEKSDDIRLMSVDEYKIYVDDYIKKSKFPDIN